MYKNILIFVLLYFLAIFFSIVSEITYKKRNLRDVIYDFKQIWYKSSILFLIFIMASIIYYFFGVNSFQ